MIVVAQDEWSSKPGVAQDRFYCILQTAHFGLTQEWLRVLSLSRLECGVHNKLHIYPVCGIFYFPWHRYQIEGTNGF